MGFFLCRFTITNNPFTSRGCSGLDSPPTQKKSWREGLFRPDKSERAPRRKVGTWPDCLSSCPRNPFSVGRSVLRLLLRKLDGRLLGTSPSGIGSLPVSSKSRPTLLRNFENCRP